MAVLCYGDQVVRRREAVRVAAAHVLFKIVGVALIVGFIPQLAELVGYISPVAEAGVTGMDKLAAETPRQIANAHTLFNVGIAVLFLPAANLFARFCEWVVPDRPLEAAEAHLRATYLDDALIRTPSRALEETRYEIGHMGENVREMVTTSMPAFLAGDPERIREISAIDDKVDFLYSEIVAYLGKVSKQWKWTLSKSSSGSTTSPNLWQRRFRQPRWRTRPHECRAEECNSNPSPNSGVGPSKKESATPVALFFPPSAHP